jgi:hypothetical protein
MGRRRRREDHERFFLKEKKEEESKGQLADGAILHSLSFLLGAVVRTSALHCSMVANWARACKRSLLSLRNERKEGLYQRMPGRTQEN